MTNVIQVPTYEQIETILSKLATNYSNLASVFYDVFYNTTPMDVTFEMYDTSGVLQSYTIPNRAKDFASKLEGEGNPEGQIDAGLGVIYQDLSSGKVYIKGTEDGNEGWEEVATKDYLNTILVQGNGSPERVITASRGTLYVDLTSASLYIKTTVTGNSGWLLISASTSVLANRDLSNLTTTGEGHFANPSLSNLSTAGNAIINGKENVSNKKTTISSASTDTEYPSAKAVYTYVSNSVDGLADTSLSNLTSQGKLKFIDWSHLRDCVLAAGANGALVHKDGGSIKIPAEMIMLGANGLTADKRFNNALVIVSTEQELSGAQVGVSDQEFYILCQADPESGYTSILPRKCKKSNFFVSTEEPSLSGIIGVVDYIWYNPAENQYYFVPDPDGDVPRYWSPAVMTLIGEFYVNALGNLSSVTAYSPLELVTVESREVAHVVVEVGGTEDNWYRLYKDGWLEQGGYLTGGGDVTFNKEYSTSNYTFVPSANATSFTKTATGVTITEASASDETDWLASGWAAS